MGTEDKIKLLKQYVEESSAIVFFGGTSLAVYPAAGLIDYFTGKHLVVINRDATPRDAGADLLIQGNIGEVLSGI